MALTINRLNKQIKQMTTQTQDKISDVTTLMEETLSGIRVIQSFSAEEHEITRFYQENHAAKELSMRSVRRQAQLKPWIDVIGAVGIAFALWTAGHLIVSNHLTVMSMLGFIGYVNQVSVGINNWGGVKSTWEQMKAAAERINENVLSVEAEIKERPGAVDLGDVQGRIEFRDVSFAYNHDNPVLQNVSFVMEPGQVVAVVGASGAGKSTLADLIPRFYDPNSGCVLVDGHDIRDVKLSSLRAHIGIVPQETVLFGGSIRDNIAYGDPGANDSRVEEAARAANAHHFIQEELSDGYDTLVGERGKQLSGGQRQRISIARALLKDPRILILDEATSSLDTRSEVLVQKALDELMKGRTTLVIAHRLSTIMNADRILVMQSGRVLESGTHRDLLARGGAYAKLYETQYRWEAEERPARAVAS
jgi:subfamily B ATP-binding cassette protein MsbA